MNAERVKWTFFGDPSQNAKLSRPAAGERCRWIAVDMLEGLVEFEATANAAGMPDGEWTEQVIRCYRVVDGPGGQTDGGQPKLSS